MHTFDLGWMILYCFILTFIQVCLQKKELVLSLLMTPSDCIDCVSGSAFFSHYLLLLLVPGLAQQLMGVLLREVLFQLLHTRVSSY
jgi:hypothetical protein